MTTDTVPQTVLFPDLFDKPLFAKFNQEQASSDGGAVLLKAAERVYGVTSIVRSDCYRLERWGGRLPRTASQCAKVDVP